MENEMQTLSLSEKIKSKFNTGALQSFFMGKGYPLVTALLIFFSHTFGLEVYLSFFYVALFFVAILVCDSVRPLIIALTAFTYQVSMQNTPGGPVWSTEYVTGASPYIIAVTAALAVTAVVYMLVKFRVFSDLSFKKTPLLLSMCVLGVAFLLNGAFSETWEARGVIYGAVQAVIFPLIFLVYYKGLKNEKDLDSLGLYVSYVAAVIGVVLAAQVAYLYLFGGGFYPTIFNDAGGVIKERIHFGWATWNPAGACISILIPTIFYGVIKGKYPILYFIAAVLTYGAALLTFSRNAMIFATLAFLAGVFIACFVGEKKRKMLFRILVGVGALSVAFFGIVFWSEISVFAKDILDRGFSDNGRFSVWGVAIENFKTAPVFGTGFYHFYSPILHNLSPVIPLMAHQTFLQLLSSMGVVGLAAYLYYRFDTLEMFIRKPTLLKTMLGLSALTLLCGSLLDNFIFVIFPTFFYGVTLAIAALIYERQNEGQETDKKSEKKKNSAKKSKKRWLE